MVQRSNDFAGIGSEPHYPPDLRLEPRHIELDISFDFEAKALSGAVVTTVESRVDGPRSLCLNAVDLEDLRVDDADGAALEFAYDGKEIRATWVEPFAAGETRRLRVLYRVVEPVTGLVFSAPDEAYPDRPLYAATDHETERARYWLPCIDLPSVRTTYGLRLTAPGDLTVLASGARQRIDNNGDGTQTALWSLDYPCPSYLICVAIGDFCRYDDETVDGVEIAYFGPRVECTPDDLRRSFGRTPAMMKWLTERLDATFPFPKYYQFAVPGIPGAMENISLVSWDSKYINDEILAREASFDVDATNIHEMAHSYFGGAIVIRDHSHSWLKESWATYIETVWLEETDSIDSARYDLWRNTQRYIDEADHKYARPIHTRNYATSWQMFDRHTYPGGACRIHMLRAMLGDDVFWPAVREYVARFSKDVVETADLRRILEKHSGRMLQRFFDEWIHSPGYPKLAVRFRHDKEGGCGVFTIEQIQKDEKKNIGIFHLDLDLAWEDDEGECHRVSVALGGEGKKDFAVHMAAKPRQVRVDPDGRVLRKLSFNPGNEMLRRQLTDAVDVEGRILAARELAETGKLRNIEAIRDACKREPFWGVRVEMARALAKAKSEHAIAPLAEMLQSESEPKAMAKVATACGSYRDGRVASALRSYLDREDLGYRARAAALEGLAKQRDEDDWRRLVESLDARDWKGFVRGGALRAFGYTRSRAAIELLAARTGYGKESDRCRPWAIRALAMALQWRDPHERLPHEGELIDLLRDPMEPVRWAAAAALGAVGTARAVAPIRAMKTTVAPQDHPAVDAIIEKIRSAAKGGPPARMKDDVEQLEETVRKLEARLQKLEAKSDSGS